MVVIPGEGFDVTEMIEGYPQGGIERELLETMSQSAARYRFSSPAELRFELKFRKAVVNSALRLHRSGLDFEVFHKSRCNEEYWTRKADGGFRLNRDADPAEAVSDIYSHGGKYATECATAMVIVYLGAALEVYGAGAFGRLFPDIYLMNWHNISPLLQGIGIPRSVDDILYGDRGYIANPDVDPKAPEWRGENVIVLPGGLYYGHGAGIRPASGMIAMLNSHRRKDATESAYMMDAAARPNYRVLYEAYGQPAAQRQAQSAPSHIVWGPFPAPVARGM